MKNINTTVHKITKHLRQEITAANLKSGQHLKETEIAKIFGVSRVPVREAFRILQSEGYLDVKPNKGSFVKKITKDHVSETGIVYKLLVPFILEAAIPRYTDKTYKKAEAILNKIEKCKDLNSVGYLLWEFARVIFKPSKMEFVLNIFDEVYAHNIRLLNDLLEIKQKNYDISYHRKFIELCKTKTREEAIQHWVEYVEKVEKIMINIFK